MSSKTKDQLLEENAHLRAKLDEYIDPKHARLVSFIDGQWEFHSPIFGIFAETLAQMLTETGAENYLEMEMTPRDEAVGPVTLTIQKRYHPTPHAKRVEAEMRLGRVLDAIRALEDDIIREARCAHPIADRLRQIRERA